MQATVKKFQLKKEEMMAEAGYLRNEIDQLYKKLSKDPNELIEFISTSNGFSDLEIDKVSFRNPFYT